MNPSPKIKRAPLMSNFKCPILFVRVNSTQGTLMIGIWESKEIKGELRIEYRTKVMNHIRLANARMSFIV
jgi:hypothetical protein